MEQSYVSAAFFRHLTKERLQRHQAEQLLADGTTASLQQLHSMAAHAAGKPLHSHCVLVLR